MFTQLFCGLRGTSRVKSVSSCQTHLSMFIEFVPIRSAKAPAFSVFLFLLPSHILWVFKRLNCFISFLFTILLMDKPLIPVCFSISLGDTCLLNFRQFPNSPLLQLFEIFPNQVSYPLILFFKSIQKPLNRDFLPVLSGMLFGYAMNWPLFFIKIVLDDSFFFFCENHDFCKESCIFFVETKRQRTVKPFNVHCNDFFSKIKTLQCNLFSEKKRSKER